MRPNTSMNGSRCRFPRGGFKRPSSLCRSEQERGLSVPWNALRPNGRKSSQPRSFGIARFNVDNGEGEFDLLCRLDRTFAERRWSADNEWTYQPSRIRVKTESGGPLPGVLYQYLSSDHNRLDRLLEQAAARPGTIDMESYSEFSQGAVSAYFD